MMFQIVPHFFIQLSCILQSHLHYSNHDFFTPPLSADALQRPASTVGLLYISIAYKSKENRYKIHLYKLYKLKSSIINHHHLIIHRNHRRKVQEVQLRE